MKQTQTNRKLQAAVVQASPAPFNKKEGILKTASTITALKPEKPEIILFPEAIIPGYPRDLMFGTRVGSRTESGRITFREFYEQSVEIPSDETRILSRAVKQTGAFTAIGLVERENGSLYCSLVYFGPGGEILGVHRKLKPTASERLIWGEGDGSSLLAFRTEKASIGGLICWENYMPLARMAMYNQGVEIYLAPTADQRESWQNAMKFIANEGRCFVLGCNQFATRDMFPAVVLAREGIPLSDEVICRGGSVIVAPGGEVLAGPLFDREGILLADLDLNLIPEARFDLDVAGHYQRKDVFSFHVNNQPERIPVSPGKAKIPGNDQPGSKKKD